MNRITIATLLLLAVGFSIACNRATNEVLPDGTKVFGKRTLENGTTTEERVEYPNGERQLGITILPDGTTKVERVEKPDGTKMFGATVLPDGTQIVSRVTRADGTEITTVSTAQNDQQGYADVKWGAAITDLDSTAEGTPGYCFSGDREDGADAVAAAFGAPTRDTVVAGVVLSTDFDFSALPERCKTVAKGDVKLIFYDDKLAMAFTHLDAHNYDAILSEMASKFSEMDGWSVKWGGGASSDGDYTSLNVRLFRRGNTNTRVFLLKETNHEGCCGINVSSVYLLYVPNADYMRIQGDMAKLKHDKEAQQIAAKQKEEHPDLEKIQ